MTGKSTILVALENAGTPEDPSGSQAAKKNYAEALSRGLAQIIADHLRPHFKGDILPDPEGKGHESRARSDKGYKKLDVNYSTLDLGLALGVSIKTVVSRDPKSKRYTKNYTRIENELRAEAADYHARQPFAVMAALIFLPMDACTDSPKGSRDPSSFGQAVRIFRRRAGRETPHHDKDLFEGIFIGLYETEGKDRGKVGFFDVDTAPPKHTRPPDLLTLDALMEAIVDLYNRRNGQPFEWAEDE